MRTCLLALLLTFQTLTGQDYLSPVAVDFHGSKLAVAQFDSSRLDLVDPESGRVEASVPLQGKPNGLCIEGDTAFVTTGGVHGRVEIVDLAKKEVVQTIPAGHTPMSPVVRNGKLYFCNRFDNNVMVVRLPSGAPEETFEVRREPVALCVSADGSTVWVGNHLPAGPADGNFTASEITCRKDGQTTHYPLANGTQGIRGMALSPDGKHLAIAHVLSRYQVPTTQLDRGWINTNAVTLMETVSPEVHDAILLDDVDFGASNPWAVAFTPGGERLIVTHAGIHEISVIDFPALTAKIKASKDASRHVNQLSFLDGVRVRIPLPLNGPRALATDGDRVFVPGYFTDNLAVVTLGEHPVVKSIDLTAGKAKAPDMQRRGHMYFNDASLCFQAWESCASCHPDGRMDGLNWDLMNDGIGNPKNTRSMFLSHRMPPVMTLGIRKQAEVAVQAGFRHIQFVEPEPDHTDSVDEYLRNMPLVASPHLRRDKPEEVEIKKQDCLLCHAPAIERGALSDAARRGKEIFKKAGCVQCHPHPLYTTRAFCDVGTLKGIDLEDGKKVTVPTLVEVWRTAPYFHDGRTSSLREVVTIHNKDDKRGKTSDLTEREIDDLVQYLQSL